MPVNCWVSHSTVFQHLSMSLCDWKTDDSPANQHSAVRLCTTGTVICCVRSNSVWLERCISTFCTGMKEAKKALLQGFTATSGWIWAFILKVHLLTHLSNLFKKIATKSFTSSVFAQQFKPESVFCHQTALSWFKMQTVILDITHKYANLHICYSNE